MKLTDTLNDLRRYLPIQFPLGAFIHNNMLLSFEDRPFAQGVAEAAKLFGAERALPESYYQDKFSRGRIQRRWVDHGIQLWLKDHAILPSLGGIKLENLLWQMMERPLNIPHRVPEAAHPDWVVRCMRLRAPILPHAHISGKEWKHTFKEQLGEDVNAFFHPLFIRFLSSYLDQGMSTWHNPDTHKSLLESFRAFVSGHKNFTPTWLKAVQGHLQELNSENVESWLEEYLRRLPFTVEPRTYLLDTLLELRGWAGMVNKFETESHLVPRFAPSIRLMEYLAIYLILEKCQYEEIIAHHSLTDMRVFYNPTPLQRLSTAQMAHILAHMEPLLMAEESDDMILQTVLDVVVKFHASERAVVWQQALDLSMRDQCLESLIAFRSQSRRPATLTPTARFYFCIDDREESIRRYLEEAHPEYETHGVVGFFGIDMKFKSFNHPEPILQCPPVVNPSRVVEEIELEGTSKPKSFGHVKWGQGNWHFWYGTRGALRSLPFTLLTGPVTSLALFMRVFFPHAATRMHSWMKQLLLPKTQTRIKFLADEASLGGYTVPEMAKIVATIFKFTGTLKDFPRFNFIVAHGATSSNNPYKNAYGCGACSGKSGIPNSQIFCGMANMPKVRDELRAAHGIDIPAEARFLACYHDTSTDEILFFNRADIPKEDHAEVDQCLEALRQAGRDNSLERCRHFANARHIINEKLTFHHVLDRASSLAEPRPEYGHNNTAMVVVGRRGLTRGLYLDRRCFLASYDAATDPQGETLASVLAGAVPVAGGISLDYYFSRIDNEVYGSGTKLPLNIAALLGVMTGSSSDLRIGLAKQMVELHEPVRITIIIEAEAEVVMRLVEAHPRMARMVKNEWIHFALVHPKTGELLLFQHGSFGPYVGKSVDLDVIHSSKEYAPHRRGPLPFVRVEAT
jgi:uncharacterized protein